jgi:hypothetical protein
METLGSERWEKLVAEAESMWITPVMIAARMKQLFPDLGLYEVSVIDTPKLISHFGKNLTLKQGQVLWESLMNYAKETARASESFEDGI